MHILKTFIDGQGVRHKVGDPAPKEWDKPTLAHYQRHGMVGDLAKPKAPRQRKPADPAETKPAAPAQTQSAAPEQQTGAQGDETTGSNAENQQGSTDSTTNGAGNE